HADGMPFTKRDHPVIAAARYARRTAFLLAAADAVRERVVGVHVIHLRRRLVVPGAPGLSTVHSHDGALIACQRDDVRRVRIDPGTLVVVAAWRAAKRHPRPAAVGRFPGDGARHDDDVFVLRADSGYRQISAADSAGGP